MIHEVRRPVGQRVATFVALALIHVVLIAYLTLTRWPSAKTTDQAFVTQVFFLTEVPSEPEVRAAPSPAPRAHRSTPTVRPAPITLPPEPPSEAAPSPSPRIDWALEAERSASRQLQKDLDAERRAAPFSHDFNARAPARPSPRFGWSHARTQRIEPLENGGTFIWINDRCGIALVGAVFPVCMIGKIPARSDLFEHMNDPPVLGEAPRPP